MCPYSRSVVFHFRHLLVNSFPQHVREMGMGTGFAKTRGYATRAWVCFQNQLRNLATAVQVSIDTAVHIARLNSVGGVGISSLVPIMSLVRGSLVDGMLEGGIYISYSCSCSRSCRKLALMRDSDGCDGRTPWFGSASIHKGECGVEGRRVVFVDQRPFALVVCFRSCTSVVCVRQLLCGFRGFRRRRGPDKPNLSVGGG